MAWTSWPHDYEPDGTTPAETYEEDFRFSLSAATQDGVDPAYGGALNANVSGSDLVLSSGRGVVDGYGFRGDAPTPVPIPPNSSSLPRLYRVVARLDVAAHQVLPHVIEGTAATNPQPPTLTRTDVIYDQPLWLCRRNGGNGAISQVTDERVYLNPAGAVACTSTTRPPNPLPGTTIYESDTGRLCYYHGGQWVTAADGEYPKPWQPIPLLSRYTSYSGSGYAPQWRWETPTKVALRGTVARTDGEPMVSGDYIGILPHATHPGAFHRHIGGAHLRAGGWSVRWEIRSSNVTNRGQISFWHGYGANGPTWAALDGFVYDIN